METRVRFAPSPTGFFHVGSARTALFNWLYARHTNGRFILRIEDTDKARNTPEALAGLLEGMRWLGLDWDEGPECGGDFGPYFQSQRTAIYETYLEKLYAAGRAYEKDGTVYFKLLGERYTTFDKYQGAEVEKVKTVPVVIEDAVRGRVERAVEMDFVIRRQNGDFGFHFVNVVDDIAMGITHVIRGEDHLSNTARHVEIFNALQAPLPVFAHIPLILKDPTAPVVEGEKKGGKMSKRDRGALIEEYQQRNFLPQAVRNYLCLLGWNPKNDREIMPIGEIIEHFDFGGINKDNAQFDERKLGSINTEYLRALPVETLVWMASPLLSAAGLIDESSSEDYVRNVLALSQEKVKSLESLPEFVQYFFTDDFSVEEKALSKILKKGNAPELIAQLQPALEQITDWQSDSIDAAFSLLADAQGVKKFDYFPVVRLAVSGTAGGPDLLGLLQVLGQTTVLRRISSFAERISGE